MKIWRRRFTNEKNFTFLVLFGVGVFYLMVLIAAGIEGDFRDFWGAGYIANRYGYPAVYDLSIVSRVEAELWNSIPLPFPYLPIFLPIFQLLALLPYSLAYYLWELLNLLLIGGSLYIIVRRVTPNKQMQWFFSGLLSFPVFYNLLWAQVNAVLMVAVYLFFEFLRARKGFWAGLALGGLWLKPQTLPLFILGIALYPTRYRQVLKGFLLTTLVILGVSAFLLRGEGVKKMFELWMGYGQGIPTNNPGDMMNWRMIMVHLTAFGPGWKQIGWTIALAGILFTLMAAIRLWLFPLETPQAIARNMLGTLAATALVAWHSHVHMEMFLLPPLLYLVSRDEFPQSLLHLWLFFPPLLLLLLLGGNALCQVGWLPDWPFLSHGASWFGGFYFLYNIMLLGWVIFTVPSEGVQ